MSQEVQSLLLALAASEVTQRREAAESLARIGPEAVDVAVAIVKACGDDDEQVRNWVVAALEELPAPNASTAKSLENLINDENLDVAFWATTLLGRMEHDAASTVKTLASAVVSYPELVVRQRAAWALGKIGKPAAEAIPQLETALRSDDARLARFAAVALEQIRP